MSIAGSFGLKSLFSLASLVGQDIVARSIRLTQAAASNAITIATAGARLKFSDGGTTDYITSDGSASLSAAGPFRASQFGLAALSFNSIFDGATAGINALALALRGNVANGATAIGVAISNFPNLTTAGGKIAAFYPDNFTTEKLAVDIAGKLVFPTATADAVAGIATLVAGTVTVNTTSVTANSVILTARKTTGGTEGHLRISASVAGTSFTITSSSALDTSTVSWLLVN